LLGSQQIFHIPHFAKALQIFSSQQAQEEKGIGRLVYFLLISADNLRSL
jgi:hypothetical protein